MTDLVTPPPPPPDVRTPSRSRRAAIALGAAALVLTVVGAFALVSAGRDDDAHAQPLSLVFTAGRSESYSIHQTIDGSLSSELIGGEQPITLDMTQRVTWTVTDVDPRGIATIEVTIDHVSGSVDGRPLPAASTAIPPVEIRVAPDGRVVSAGGLALGGAGQTQGFGFPGMSQLTPILPDDGVAVAPGDTWHKSFSQPFPFGDGKIAFTARSRYERDETIDGTPAALISTDMDVPLDFTVNVGELLDAVGSGDARTGATGLDLLRDATLTYDGAGTISQTSWVDLDAKELLRSRSSGRFDISVGLAGVPGFDGTLRFSGSFSQDVATA
jgi:hypothetical protein